MNNLGVSERSINDDAFEEAVKKNMHQTEAPKKIETVNEDRSNESEDFATPQQDSDEQACQ